MFYMYQDSIYDELEDKWSKKKAEWEKDEKLEREKILLKQKHNITKKFELESEEEKKKIQDSHSAVFENFNREKEELLKQHERDTLQLEELRKTKEVIEEELHTQALILESLNTTLYQTQMELQKEKAVVGNLEKKLQTKLAEAEEKFKYTIQLLTEENIHLRQKIIAKNEEIYQRYGRSPSLTVYEEDSDTLEDGSKKRQESWAEKLFSVAKDGRNPFSVGLENCCEVSLRNAYGEFSSWVALIVFVFSQFASLWVVWNVWMLISIT